MVYLTCLDYDDTLLCSSHLSSLGYDLEKHDVDLILANKLRALDIKVCELMKICSNKGDVIIITNSEPGWVHVSSKIYLPKFYEYITELAIPVISAKARYGEKYPYTEGNYGVYCVWKANTMNDIFPIFLNKYTQNTAICIGDTENDRLAAIQYIDSNTVVKTIKFMERPHIDVLIKEIDHIKDSYEKICSDNGLTDMDMKIIHTIPYEDGDSINVLFDNGIAITPTGKNETIRSYDLYIL